MPQPCPAVSPPQTKRTSLVRPRRSEIIVAGTCPVARRSGRHRRTNARALFKLWNLTRTNTSEPVRACERLPHREIRRFERVRSDHALHLAKLLIVGPLDHHASRPIAATPHDDGAVTWIAEREALKGLRPRLSDVTRPGAALASVQCGRARPAAVVIPVLRNERRDEWVV